MFKPSKQKKVARVRGSKSSSYHLRRSSSSASYTSTSAYPCESLIRPETPSPSPRGPHSAHRTSTLLHFTQAVYLLFSAIYVCKDSVEHALLHHSGSVSIPTQNDSLSTANPLIHTGEHHEAVVGIDGEHVRDESMSGIRCLLAALPPRACAPTCDSVARPSHGR
ncbi:hypothetical protein CF328_g6164 [Tilletia controversa]|nr:hypothetical protein CF328_g6164 [Tilletia controversa]